jgi:hypothetical protein
VKFLAEGPRRDLKTRYEFWSSYQGRASYLGNRMNDLYLKANGIKAGVKNYDEMTTLLVGYFRRNNGLHNPGGTMASTIVVKTASLNDSGL